MFNELYSWPFKKTVGGVKDQILGLFKRKDNSKPECLKTVFGGGKKQSEENLFQSIKNLYKLKKKMKQLKIE